MKLSVILVNYNVCDYLELALHALSKASLQLDTELIVVDNASSDDSKTHLPRLFPDVRFIWLEKNIGFSKANNLALKEITGTHVLFLNPDTIVAENALLECMNQFKNHPETAAIGVYMIDGDGNYLPESKRGFPDPMTSFFKLTGLSKLFPNSSVLARYYMGSFPKDQIASVDVLSGAFMMASKKMMDRVGGFDDTYFMYGEDIDLSIRIKKTGFKNVYLPNARILHFKGESTQKLDPEYKQRFFGAMTMFAEKYYASNRLGLTLLKAAIWTAKKLHRPASLKSSTKNKEQHSGWLIVADHVRFNEMIHRIKLADEPVTISGRIAIHEEDEHPYTCSLENLETWLIQHPGHDILFCESPSLSFFEILRQMERLKSLARFYFHAEGARSIVGKSGFNIGAPKLDESENVK